MNDELKIRCWLDTSLTARDVFVQICRQVSNVNEISDRSGRYAGNIIEVKKNTDCDGQLANDLNFGFFHYPITVDVFPFEPCDLKHQSFTYSKIVEVIKPLCSRFQLESLSDELLYNLESEFGISDVD